MKAFKRHTLTAVLLSLLTSCVANAQQEDSVDESLIFDDAPPTVEDNLPPDGVLPVDPEADVQPKAQNVGDASEQTGAQDEQNNNNNRDNNNVSDSTEGADVQKPAFDENAQPPSADSAGDIPEDAGILLPLRQSIIGDHLRPANSMQPALAAFFQGVDAPKAVTIGGNSYTLHNPERVRAFYQNERFPTIWTQDHQFTNRLGNLQKVIFDAPKDALPRQRYWYDVIQPLQAGTNYNDIIAYEVLLTDAYLTLAGDLANGLVNPKKTQPEWNGKKVSEEELGDLLAHAVVSGDLAGALANLNINNIAYQTLKARYNAIRGNAPENAGPPLPAVTLRPGMVSKAVPILRQKLGVAGDSNVYDPELVEAVKAYQKSLGMQVDGIVGSGTRATLNATHKAVANDLMINMERQRWMPQEIGKSYILVNIPSFVVKMYQNNKEVYSSKAVVGRKDRQTPAFTDHMRHVVMSPTWTVPPTIMRRDKLARLRSNPGAFDGSFEVVTPGGRVVRPSAINWNAVNPANYALRQKPGRRNALGRVKFLFPNKHAIYLHDTPSKGLFNRSVRAFSSGCVRLQKPEEFAQVLLKNTNWSNQRIRKAMSQTREQWVNTPAQTPIYLVYWTVWATPDGNVHFAKDIYGKDGTLLKQYQQAMK